MGKQRSRGRESRAGGISTPEIYSAPSLYRRSATFSQPTTVYYLSIFTWKGREKPFDTSSNKLMGIATRSYYRCSLSLSRRGVEKKFPLKKDRAGLVVIAR